MRNAANLILSREKLEAIQMKSEMGHEWLLYPLINL